MKIIVNNAWDGGGPQRPLLANTPASGQHWPQPVEHAGESEFEGVVGGAGRLMDLSDRTADPIRQGVRTIGDDRREFRTDDLPPSRVAHPGFLGGRPLPDRLAGVAGHEGTEQCDDVVSLDIRDVGRLEQFELPLVPGQAVRAQHLAPRRGRQQPWVVETLGTQCARDFRQGLDDGRRRPGHRSPCRHVIDHERHQHITRRHIGVQTHRPDAQFGGQGAHRDRSEPALVREVDRRRHDVVDRYPLPRPPPRADVSGLGPPEQSDQRACIICGRHGDAFPVRCTE